MTRYSLTSLALWMLAAGLAAAQAPALQTDFQSPGPANLREVFFADAQHGVVAGNIHRAGPALAWTDNGGTDWQDATVDVDLNKTNPEGLWLHGQVGWALFWRPATPPSQLLLRTEDGGKSWKSQPAPQLQKVPAANVLWFDADGQRGWINTGGGPLYKTDDGGQSWAPVDPSHYQGTLKLGDKPLGGNFGHRAFYAFSADHVMIAGTAGAFLETTDRGATWRAWQVPLQTPAGQEGWAGISALSFAPDGQSGWAVGGEGDRIANPNGWAQMRTPLVLRTTDGGRTWERRTLQIKAPLDDVWALSAQEAWLCGQGGYALSMGAPGTLRRTTDGGQTWQNMHPGIGAIRKLFFLDATHGWAAGGAGGGLEAESTIVIITPAAG